MTVSLITCPFPPCRWHGTPITQQARFGDPETNQVMPIHDVEGEAAWFGRCPGSQLIVPMITADGARVIESAMREYSKRRLAMLQARVEKERADAEEKARDPRNRRPGESYVDWLTRKARDFPPEPPGTEGIADLLLKHGPRVDPRVKNDDYFPGRPADAPEPGVGDPPDKPPAAAADATIIPLGGAVDNARDNLKALVTATMAGCDSTIEDLVRVLGLVERALAMTQVAQEAHQNTRAIANVAVGADHSNLPEEAQNMLGLLAVAGKSIEGGADANIVGYLTGVRDSVMAAIGQMRGAKHAARTYRDRP